MDEYQLDEYCRRHPYCDCKCHSCWAFIQHIRHEMGWDECEEDYEVDDDDNDE